MRVQLPAATNEVLRLSHRGTDNEPGIPGVCR
jgi:hypothetical protein